jgi:hypothetical protein
LSRPSPRTPTGVQQWPTYLSPSTSERRLEGLAEDGSPPNTARRQAIAADVELPAAGSRDPRRPRRSHRRRPALRSRRRHAAPSEESQLVLAGHPDLALDGLILAGMLVGALGVLDDLTVSQASAVMAIRRAAPAKGWHALYREALKVGRDHVAATVNTLVLAYAGAALPVLLIFTVGGTAFGDAVNVEEVAQEIVATLVGSIGLVLAVPLTTALAAALAVRLPQAALPTHTHPH